ncbi:hypothetical protein BDN67DRAFT_985407 [Paxillus ammoniavirescens]|nr:hypothetical protein BDN67DRAFT_985407 [Paxillus ammoniavirescens]
MTKEPSLQVVHEALGPEQACGTVPSLVRQHAFCDSISTAMWITPKGEAQEILCFGTGLGYLIFWRQCASLPAQFKELNMTVPKGITFVTRQDGLYVWGMYNRAIVETGSLIRSYSTRPTVCKPKQVAFEEKGSIIVGGSESGVVYIFDRKTGNPIQMLRHICDGERETTIIAGMHTAVQQANITPAFHVLLCLLVIGVLVMLISEVLYRGLPIQSLIAAVSKIFGEMSSSNETSGEAAVPELIVTQGDTSVLNQVTVVVNNELYLVVKEYQQSSELYKWFVVAHRPGRGNKAIGRNMIEGDRRHSLLGICWVDLERLPKMVTGLNQ